MRRAGRWPGAKHIFSWDPTGDLRLQYICTSVRKQVKDSNLHTVGKALINNERSLEKCCETISPSWKAMWNKCCLRKFTCKLRRHQSCTKRWCKCAHHRQGNAVVTWLMHFTCERRCASAPDDWIHENEGRALRMSGSILLGVQHCCARP